MESSLKEKKLRIGGMTCVNCQNKIEEKLRDTVGIQHAEVNYNTGIASVTYDTDVISLKNIIQIIERLDYQVLIDQESPSPDRSRAVGLLVIIAALYMIVQQMGILNLLVPSQLAEANMQYGMLFVIGLITSVHCVAMCGGINLSQCIPKGKSGENTGRFSVLRPTFLYNLGRVISYTAVGFVVGGLGSVITFSNGAQGALKLIAGVFMVIMGINMLGIFPWLRRLNPRMPNLFARKVAQGKARSNSPLIVGLLNGFMPCGPLQAMQIYALSTGNPFAGALSMLLFSLGTVPLMFGLGALSSVIGKRFTQKVMTVGAVLVVVLGLSMFSQGWSLSGFDGISFGGISDPRSGASNTDVVIEDGVQIVNSTLASGRYPAITVQAGMPVKWVIDAPEGSINGCNNRMFVREYGIEYSFKTGENIIEFTPDKTSTFPYSCWMGMIRSTITVVEPGAETGASADGKNAQNSDSTYESNSPAQPVPANYVIPTEAIAVAKPVIEGENKYQTVTLQLTDKGFSPAIAVVQAGMETKWVIDNKTTSTGSSSLLAPAYYTELPLESGENPFYLLPTESFEFSNGDSTFYGYVKVVDNLDAIDSKAIKKEVTAFETLIYPPAFFNAGGGGGASCH